MRRMIAAVLGLMLAFSTQAQLRPGDRPPDDLGKGTDGQPVSLASLHGQVVVISFWATWCSYCLKEMPILAGLQGTATERHLPLQVVSIDYKEDRHAFLRVARLLHQRMPQLLLSWDGHGAIGKPYGADNGIPVMVMLHRDGTVAHVHSGYSEDMLDTIVAEINQLLVEPGAPSVAVTASGH